MGTVIPDWNFYVDLDDDGDFSGACENITDFVISAEWQLGFTAPYEVMGRDNTLTIALDNTGQKFSPEIESNVLSASLTRGKVVKIESVWDGTSRIHHTGWIKGIRPVPGASIMDMTAEIETEGYFERIQQSESFIPLQEGKKASEVIQKILEHSSIWPPGASGRWFLGKGNLGQTTILGAISDYLDADAGQTTFDFIGDQWGDGVSIYKALENVAGREYGRVYVSRDGKIKFLDRHHLILKTTTSAEFNENQVEMDYAYGDIVRNLITVKARPRKISATPETLGQTDRPVKFKENASRLVTFNYRDQDAGVKISGRDVLVPSSGVDYQANSASDGTGTDFTGSLKVQVLREFATKSEVEFINTSTSNVIFLESGARVTGTKITDFGLIEASKINVDSVDDYGVLKWVYPFETDDFDDAEALAEYFVDTFGSPRGETKSITLVPYESSAITTSALDLTIGDRINIVETQTGTSKNHFIIGEQHQLGPTPQNYVLTWFLENADATLYWILGTTAFSELGETTTLGPL